MAAATARGRRKISFCPLLSRLCSDSDCDDDVPLSALRAKAPAVKEEVKTEVKSEVKGELPAVNGLSANGNGNGKRQAAPDSDSDDDIPISGLAKRKKMKVETKVKAEKASVATPSSRATPRNTPRKTKKRVIKVSEPRCAKVVGCWGKTLTDRLCRLKSASRSARRRCTRRSRADWRRSCCAAGGTRWSGRP